MTYHVIYRYPSKLNIFNNVTNLVNGDLKKIAEFSETAKKKISYKEIYSKTALARFDRLVHEYAAQVQNPAFKEKESVLQYLTRLQLAGSRFPIDQQPRTQRIRSLRHVPERISWNWIASLLRWLLSFWICFSLVIRLPTKLINFVIWSWATWFGWSLKGILRFVHQTPRLIGIHSNGKTISIVGFSIQQLR